MNWSDSPYRFHPETGRITWKHLKSNMPASGVVKGNWGNIGKMRQEEATKLGGFKPNLTKKSKPQKNSVN